MSCTTFGAFILLDVPVLYETNAGRGRLSAAPNWPVASIASSIRGTMVSRADHIRQHTEKQLSSHGINVVIYANHLLRATYSAMQRAARDILTHRKAGPLNEYCVSSHDLLSLFPEPDVCSLRAS